MIEELAYVELVKCGRISGINRGIKAFLRDLKLIL